MAVSLLPSHALVGESSRPYNWLYQLRRVVRQLHPLPFAKPQKEPAAARLATPTLLEETAMAEKKTDNKRWVRKVKTVSTSPPEGIFTKDAKTIAKAMASKKVSPKGIGSGIRMIQYFINRAGKDLPAARKKELEKAKKTLQEKSWKKK
jgi:tRNA(adenine34) deaminase